MRATALNRQLGGRGSREALRGGVHHPLQWVLLALGLAGFLWLLGRSDLALLWEQAARIGAVGIAAIVVLGGLDQLFHAWGWRWCFGAGEAPRWRPLLRAHFAGNAVNLATPTAGVGGEFVRATLLRERSDDRGPGTPAAIAALTVDRLSSALADGAIGLCGLGVLLAADVPSLSPALRWTLVLATGLVLGGIAVFGALQRRGRIARFFVERAFWTRLLGPERSAQLGRSGDEIDQRVAAFHAHRGGALASSIGAHAMGSAMLVAQIGCLVALLGTTSTTSVPGVLAAFAVITALDLLAVFVPARIGAQEGARMLGASLAGLPPEFGLLLSLTQRIEQAVWTGVGLGLYARVLGKREPAA